MYQFIVVLCLIHVVLSAEIVATGGVWSRAESWCPRGVPKTGDDVLIPNGVHVVLDTNTARLRHVVVKENGTLSVVDEADKTDGGAAITFEANRIDVHGVFELGTESAPLRRHVTVLLVNDDVPVPRGDDTNSELFGALPHGSKMLAVLDNGRWDAHAVGRTPTWTLLNATARAGDTSVRLTTAVDWRVGDEIVVVSSDFLGGKQNERRTVTQVSPDRRTLSFTPPLDYEHYGEAPRHRHGFDDDFRSEVLVLTSNVVVRGDMSNKSALPIDETPHYTRDEVAYGGHTIFVDESVVRLDGIEFDRLGQGGRLARYPVHWHLRANAPGQYIRRCLIHDSMSRGITIHDTSFLRVERNVVFDVRGHAVYMEDGPEEMNQLIENIVVEVHPVGKSDKDTRSGAYKFPFCSNLEALPGIRLQFLDFEPAAFFIQNANNTFIGNRAVSAQWGFWLHVDNQFNEPNYRHNRVSPSLPPSPSLPHGQGDCDSYPPVTRKEITSHGLVFSHNVAHGISESAWWIKEDARPAERITVKAFRAWKNTASAVWSYGISNVDFDYIVVADSAGGFRVDHARERDTDLWLENALFLGETDNAGNPSAGTSSRIITMPAHCSVLYPERARTRPAGWMTVDAVDTAPSHIHMRNLVFGDMMADCTEKPFINGDDDYRGTFGALRPPPRTASGQYEKPHFVDGLFVESLERTMFKPFAYIEQPLTDDAAALNFVMYDKLGSMPCSEPGAYLLGDSPGLVGTECTYLEAHTLFVCPPKPRGFAEFVVAYFRHGGNQIVFSFAAQLEWSSCRFATPVRQVAGNQAGYATVRTSELYHMRFKEYEAARLPPLFDIRLDQARNSKHPSDVIEAVAPDWEVVVEWPGSWSATLVRREERDTGAWLPFDEGISVECRCNTTYARVLVKGNGGVQVRWSPLPSPCTTTAAPCESPWKPAAPSGSCDRMQNVRPASQPCPIAAVPQTQWPEQPSVASYDLPPSLVQTAVPVGSVASTDTCAAVVAPTPPPTTAPPQTVYKINSDGTSTVLYAGGTSTVLYETIAVPVTATTHDSTVVVATPGALAAHTPTDDSSTLTVIIVVLVVVVVLLLLCLGAVLLYFTRRDTNKHDTDGGTSLALAENYGQLPASNDNSMLYTDLPPE